MRLRRSRSRSRAAAIEQATTETTRAVCSRSSSDLHGFSIHRSRRRRRYLRARAARRRTRRRRPREASSGRTSARRDADPLAVDQADFAESRAPPRRSRYSSTTERDVLRAERVEVEGVLDRDDDRLTRHGPQASSISTDSGIDAARDLRDDAVLLGERRASSRPSRGSPRAAPPARARGSTAFCIRKPPAGSGPSSPVDGERELRVGPGCSFFRKIAQVFDEAGAERGEQQLLRVRLPSGAAEARRAGDRERGTRPSETAPRRPVAVAAPDGADVEAMDLLGSRSSRDHAIVSLVARRVAPVRARLRGALAPLSAARSSLRELRRRQTRRDDAGAIAANPARRRRGPRARRSTDGPSPESACAASRAARTFPGRRRPRRRCDGTLPALARRARATTVSAASGRATPSSPRTRGIRRASRSPSRPGETVSGVELVLPRSSSGGRSADRAAPADTPRRARELLLHLRRCCAVDVLEPGPAPVARAQPRLHGAPRRARRPTSRRAAPARPTSRSPSRGSRGSRARRAALPTSP